MVRTFGVSSSSFSVVLLAAAGLAGVAAALSAFFFSISRALVRRLSSLIAHISISDYCRQQRQERTHVLEIISPVTGSLWRAACWEAMVRAWGWRGRRGRREVLWRNARDLSRISLRIQLLGFSYGIHII